MGRAQPRTTLLAVALGAALLAAGCNGSQQSVDPGYQGDTSCVGSQGSSGSAVAPALTEPVPQVTFYGDILPILESAGPGVTYKCTTCHVNYFQPSALSSIDSVTQAINDMQQGRMPVGGNVVPSFRIQLFQIWQLQGFQVGNPNQKVAPLTATSGTGATSGCSAGGTSTATSAAQAATVQAQ